MPLDVHWGGPGVQDRYKYSAAVPLLRRQSYGQGSNQRHYAGEHRESSVLSCADLQSLPPPPPVPNPSSSVTIHFLGASSATSLNFDEQDLSSSEHGVLVNRSFCGVLHVPVQGRWGGGGALLKGTVTVLFVTVMFHLCSEMAPQC